MGEPGASAGSGAPAADDLCGQTVGRFRILERLGGGGMGVVWLAEDEQLRRRVALKVLRAKYASDPVLRKRFLREARHAARLVHPNIATVHEVGEANDQLFLVMEHISGKNLRELVRAGPLAVDDVLALMCPVARALAHAHAEGIVHRDLKPENVMVGEDGRPRLLDFGIAKLLERERSDGSTTTDLRTVEGIVLGTPEYMSPEQACGDAVDQRSDVFAFGIMLHELLANARPFRGASTTEIVTAILRDNPSPIPNIPPALQATIDRCLAKRPADRFHDAAELLARLEHHASPDGVAMGTSVVRSARRTPRRRVILAVMLAVAIVGIAIYATVFYRNASDSSVEQPIREVPLVTEPEELLEPVLAADGKHLLYALGSTIVIHSLADNRKRRMELTEHFYEPIGMLVDGSVIAEQLDARRRSLWRFGAGGDRTLLAERVTASVLSYDASRIAYHSERGIEVLELASRAVTLIVPTSTTDIVDGIAWSIDNKRLAWVRTGTAVGGAAALETAAAESSAIVETIARGGPLWSPAGAGVAFRGRDRLAVIRTDQQTALWEYRLIDHRPAGEPRKVHTWSDGFQVSGLSASVRGDQLAFRAMSDKVDTIAVSLRSKSIETIAYDSGERAGAGDWEANGNHVFTAKRGTAVAIRSKRIGDSGAKTIASECPRCLSLEVVREQLLVLQRDESEDGLLLSRMHENGAITSIARLAVRSATRFRCNQSGCWIGELRDGRFLIRALDQDFRPLNTVTTFSPPFGITYLYPSFSPAPDGRSFAIVTHGDGALYLVTTAGDTRTLVRIEGALFQDVVWSPDGARVYVTAMHVTRNNATLLSIDMNGRYEILYEEPKHWFTWPRVSPDGSWISVQRERHPTTIGLLEAR